MKLDHIGIAVRDLDKARENYRLLGLEESGRERLADQGVEICVFQLGEARIELLQPLGDGPLANFLEKRGEGLHHLAVEVADIDKELQRLREAGVRLVDEQPRRGFGGSRIAFIHPGSMSGVLIELVEKK
jgi:methylmalonyl-CoA/ethylmalonyl-CoA epimerase